MSVVKRTQSQSVPFARLLRIPAAPLQYVDTHPPTTDGPTVLQFRGQLVERDGPFQPFGLAPLRCRLLYVEEGFNVCRVVRHLDHLSEKLADQVLALSVVVGG